MYCGETVRPSKKLSEGVNRKPGSKSSFLGSPPYFYFQFRRYGHQDGRFCYLASAYAAHTFGSQTAQNVTQILECVVFIFNCDMLAFYCYIVFSALKTLNDYRSRYLSVESWKEWLSEVVEYVRTRRLSRRRDADTDESPAVEVLHYRSPEGFFASMYHLAYC